MLAVIAVMIPPAHARDVWVRITKPVIGCGEAEDDPAMKERMLQLIIRPADPEHLPEGCRTLKKGEIFMLDNEQTEGENNEAVKLWSLNCTRGCSPYMSPIFAPPRRISGVYLKRTRAPDLR